MRVSGKGGAGAGVSVGVDAGAGVFGPNGALEIILFKRKLMKQSRLEYGRNFHSLLKIRGILVRLIQSLYELCLEPTKKKIYI